MKQSTQPAPAPRRPRSVKRTILLVLLGLLLVAVALLALRIYRTATEPQIFACGAIAVPFRRLRHQSDPFSILTHRTAPDEFVLPEIRRSGETNQNLKDDYSFIRNFCGITGSINNECFKLKLAETIRPDMAVYHELVSVFFTEGSGS